jgi:hypothetical protein
MKSITQSEETNRSAVSYRNPKGRFIGNNPWTKRFNGSPFQTSKTHCPHGHPYSGENLKVVERTRTYKGKIYHYKSRICLECVQETQRKYRAKKQAKRARHSRALTKTRQH